jgi:N-acetylmuramoyl-L-alanine amidase
VSAAPLTRDQDILARTVYGEARGEGDMGKVAVAFVVCNRAEIAARYVAAAQRPHPLFGNGTPASACLVPWQFSCWNASDPNCEKLRNLDVLSEDAAPSLMAANAAISRTLEDPSLGATHYCVLGLDPYWSRGHDPVAVIGHHKFFRLG